MASDDAARLRDFERAAHTRMASSYDAFFSAVTALVLQPGFMVVRSSVPMSSAGTLLMSSAPG